MTEHGEGRVALVTGGARGIGLGISRSLAKAGFHLALCGVREAGAVEETLEELRKLETTVNYYRADVSNAEDREALVENVERDFGRLHVLVNNAGVAPTVRADILEATPDSFDRVMSINLKGPYFLTQRVANWLIKQKAEDTAFTGAIINVSSISSFVASPSRGDYCLSKAGVSMATKLWAVRLGEYGLPVYEVQPGIIKTDMTSAVTEKYDNLIDNGLLVEGRWGTPEDVGRAVAALAAGEFPYATGAVIRIDGGLGLQRL